MGQKVNPNGMRFGVNRDWHSRWYANNQDFATFLNEDIKIREFLSKALKDALVSHIDIERQKTETNNYIKIMVHVARVGVALGQNGDNINAVKKQLSKILKKQKFGLEVVDVKEPNLDANIVAQTIARKLEERASFRTAQKMAIRDVRKAGAKGCRTVVSGRLGGADIARSEGYKEGIQWLHKLVTEDLVDPEAFTQEWSTYVAKGKNHRYGLCFTWDIANIDNNTDYVMLPALTGPDGMRNITRQNNSETSGFDRGRCVLTSSCRNTALAAAWIDQMYAPPPVSAE